MGKIVRLTESDLVRLISRIIKEESVGETDEASSSAQQAAIAINMKKKGIKPKNETLYEDGYGSVEETNYENNFLNEAEYQGRKVQVGRPMRNSGGGKKYVVYVKNPSTGKIKKISFGDVHGGLSAKVSNPKARKAFASRHQCAKKKDRMTAGYWACRINRYGHLWGGKTYGGYW
jgi:hypothetical protein